MTRYNTFILLSALFLISFGADRTAADNLGYNFSFTLSAPAMEADKAYLGLEDQKKFSLNQIQSNVILIQIFSMYCPICQGEADHVNQVFEQIKNNGVLSRNIRMIGIGAGNSAFETQFFKSNYKIEFPVFSDADFTIHKMVKEVGTPHFFLLGNHNDKPLNLLFSHSGRIPDPQEFVKQLIHAAGLTE